ncbi:MAG: glycine/betaine/sarcosine/D-proline family reductase selenoprotein B [Desulfobacteraceae bacterium]|nr:glycine/betaine/sarcosine/D-proline family reductase selenoprotein B [Desulfobacteraceae bacterium]
MVHIDRLPNATKKHLLNLACPTFETTPFVQPPPPEKRRVAIITTAGLHRRNDRPFTLGSDDYRVIPGDTKANDLVMSHVSTNFDRTGFQQDLNVVFPLDRLREMAERGQIGSLADYHYSFMGATEPEKMESAARKMASLIKEDGVNVVLLVPV